MWLYCHYLLYKLQESFFFFFFTFIVLFQIKKVVLALGDYLKCTCESSIGGTRVHNDMQKLQASPPQIIVGTPGRVFDMLKRKVLRKFHISGKGVQCCHISRLV